MTKDFFHLLILTFVFFAHAASASTPIEVSLKKEWLLKGDGLSEEDAYAEVVVETPATISRFTLRVGNETPRPFVRTTEQPQTVRVRVADLPVGSYDVKVSAGRENESAKTTLHISYPLYVVVSTDWDNTRASDQVYGWVDDLHKRFPDMKYTHFFAPYHYTDPEISESRRAEIDAYVKRHRDDYGDEIGVHIHGWCHFIRTTGVRCKTKETFLEDDGSGYTTILAAYSTRDMSKILAASVSTFEENGLGTPTSFRAGGWTTDHKVMKALVENGFTVESSAVPAHRLRSSWSGYRLYDWNMANWRGITETSQPYFPNRDNVAVADLPTLNILEVPDNGVLVDYVTAQDMINIYNLNHPNGAPLSRSTVYQIGLHPVDSFYHTRYQHMIKALAHVEKHSYKNDLGPAVYVTLSELTKVFKRSISHSN